MVKRESWKHQATQTPVTGIKELLFFLFSTPSSDTIIFSGYNWDTQSIFTEACPVAWGEREERQFPLGVPYDRGPEGLQFGEVKVEREKIILTGKKNQLDKELTIVIMIFELIKRSHGGG
jgi:hypothetical protein